MKLLAFMLTGPLAGYGEMSRWDMRDTADMPTKSAIVGLLGCCFGYGRQDARLKTLDEKLRMAVRRERCGPILRDYQTVQGTILNAEHEKRGSTILTPKMYLQDSAFQIFLSGDEALLESCADAMRHPRWVTCLGRHGNPPTRPIVPRWAEAPSVRNALENWFDPISLTRRDKHMRCEMELAAEENEPCPIGAYISERNDAVILACENRYAKRALRCFTVTGGDAVCI